MDGRDKPGHDGVSDGTLYTGVRYLWKKTDDVWWPGGPDDRHVRVLRLAPLRAELWDGPARSEVAACEFAKARATGTEPNLGENRKITVDVS